MFAFSCVKREELTLACFLCFSFCFPVNNNIKGFLYFFSITHYFEKKKC